MTKVEQLEKYSAIEELDMLNVFGIIKRLIDVKSSVKREQTINTREGVLDSFASMMEKMLATNLHLSKHDKIIIVDLLDKLQTQKEYMQLLNYKIKNDKQAIADIEAASKRLAKKSQSAFEMDQ